MCIYVFRDGLSVAPSLRSVERAFSLSSLQIMYLTMHVLSCVPVFGDAVLSRGRVVCVIATAGRALCRSRDGFFVVFNYHNCK